MRVLGVVAAIAVLFGSANAAPISVANGDFEDGEALKNRDPHNGNWEIGADSWSTGGSGSAGTYEPLSLPAEFGVRVGFLNSGSSLFQLLGETIQAGVSYTLSAFFKASAGGGLFGFFVGDPSNIIGVQSIATGDGWVQQTFTLEAALLADFVGQQLGIIFLGGQSFISLDNVAVEANAGDIIDVVVIDDDNVLVNPVPGALPLMLTGLLGGWFASRRKKKKAA